MDYDMTPQPMAMLPQAVRETARLYVKHLHREQGPPTMTIEAIPPALGVLAVGTADHDYAWEQTIRKDVVVVHECKGNATRVAKIRVRPVLDTASDSFPALDEELTATPYSHKSHQIVHIKLTNRAGEVWVADMRKEDFNQIFGAGGCHYFPDRDWVAMHDGPVPGLNGPSPDERRYAALVPTPEQLQVQRDIAAARQPGGLYDQFATVLEHLEHHG